MRIVLLILTIILLVFSLFGFAHYYNEYSTARAEYSRIESLGPKIEQKQTNITMENNNTSDEEDYILESFEIKGLQAINGDFAAWIKVDGTNINYPVVKGADNNYYLNHTFEKKKSICGSIYMDYTNSKDFSDTHTMVYGHSMKDGSMFQKLKRFSEVDFFNANKSIWIYTETKIFIYEIFAYYTVESSKIEFRPGLMNNEEKDEFIQEVYSMAINSREFKSTEEDKFLTLMTCGYSSKDARVFVHAKLDSVVNINELEN